MNQRTCGDCVACCTAAEVRFEHYTKPARKTCLHVLPPAPEQKGRCGIFGQPCRPAACPMFDCAWKSGVGADEDRPDLTGVMLSVNDLNGGSWGFAVELESGALIGKGAAAVARFADSIPFPVIVASYESLPPDDTGDRVVVKDQLLQRAKSLIGAELATLREGVKVYELIDQNKRGK